MAYLRRSGSVFGGLGRGPRLRRTNSLHDTNQFTNLHLFCLQETFCRQPGIETAAVQLCSPKSPRLSSPGTSRKQLDSTRRQLSPSLQALCCHFTHSLKARYFTYGHRECLIRYWGSGESDWLSRGVGLSVSGTCFPLSQPLSEVVQLLLYQCVLEVCVEVTPRQQAGLRVSLVWLLTLCCLSCVYTCIWAPRGSDACVALLFSAGPAEQCLTSRSSSVTWALIKTGPRSDVVCLKQPQSRYSYKYTWVYFNVHVRDSNMKADDSKVVSIRLTPVW